MRQPQAWNSQGSKSGTLGFFPIAFDLLGLFGRVGVYTNGGTVNE